MKVSVKYPKIPVLAILVTAAILASGCSRQYSSPTSTTVPHEGDWGIYALDLSTQDVELIWCTKEAISHLCLNHAGDEFAFSCRIGGPADSNEELSVIRVDGTGLRQLTSNKSEEH